MRPLPVTFNGPGKAWLWLDSQGLRDRLGEELLIVRDDGALPLGTNTKGERQFADGAAV